MIAFLFPSSHCAATPLPPIFSVSSTRTAGSCFQPRLCCSGRRNGHLGLPPSLSALHTLVRTNSIWKQSQAGVVTHRRVYPSSQEQTMIRKQKAVLTPSLLILCWWLLTRVFVPSTLFLPSVKWIVLVAAWTQCLRVEGPLRAECTCQALL